MFVGDQSTALLQATWFLLFIFYSLKHRTQMLQQGSNIKYRPEDFVAVADDDDDDDDDDVLT